MTFAAVLAAVWLAGAGALLAGWLLLDALA